MKKVSKKKPKNKISYYKVVLWGSAGAGLILALYCWYRAHKEVPPIIQGHLFPTKTPGPAAPKKSYEIYQRFVDTSQRPLSEQLLPPQEVPDVSPTPQVSSSHEALPQEGASVIQRGLPSSNLKVPILPKTTKDTKTPAKASGSGKALQVGLIYVSLMQAQQGLKSLKKIAPWPPQVAVRIQQGKQGNQMIYRLILTDFTTQESFIAYKSLLAKRKIPHVPLF